MFSWTRLTHARPILGIARSAGSLYHALYDCLALALLVCLALTWSGSAHAQALKATPGQVGGVQSVTVGSAHACALTNDGAVYCWGDNTYGQLGDGTTTARTTPVAVWGLGSGVFGLSAGLNHTCARTDTAVYCWGDNTYGQLGNDSNTQSSTPVRVENLNDTVWSLAAGNDHSCAMVNGATYCWGRNVVGQLGDGTTDNRKSPVAVWKLPYGAIYLAGGWGHTCGAINGGDHATDIYCWGFNASGQVGDGTNTQRLLYVRTLIGTSQTVSLTAGSSHTCSVNGAGVMYCWGGNSYGELGDNTFTQRNTPTQVASGVKAAAAGLQHTCAVTSTGRVLCTGTGGFGQLGNGTDSTRNYFVNVSGLTDVQALGAGGYQSCAVTTSGTLYCWGRNSQGQLGDGTNTSRLTPVPVIAAKAPTGIKATAGDGAVTVSWDTPPSDHGTVSNYTVTASPGSPARTCTIAAPATACKVDGLSNGTTYTFTVKALNGVGESDSSAGVTATPQVMTRPSLPLPSGGNASVTIGGGTPGCTLSSAQFDNNVPAGAPARATFPHGVFRFEATGCTGATLAVSITYPTALETGVQLLKHGPKTAGGASQWFTPTTASISTDRLTVSYSVTDNGEGDSDTTVGTIRDPFAPVLLPAPPVGATSIPTLSEWGLIWMSLFAAATGMWAVRRRSV